MWTLHAGMSQDAVSDAVGRAHFESWEEDWPEEENAALLGSMQLRTPPLQDSEFVGCATSMYLWDAEFLGG